MSSAVAAKQVNGMGAKALESEKDSSEMAACVGKSKNADHKKASKVLPRLAYQIW
jgi:hypothetical protein